MDSELKTIGSRIKQLRIAQSLNQDQLTYPGQSSSTIIRIENGHEEPPPELLIWLATKLNCEPRHLRDGLSSLDQTELKTALNAARQHAYRGATHAACQAYEKMLSNPILALASSQYNAALFEYASTLKETHRFDIATRALVKLIPRTSVGSKEWSAAYIALLHCYWSSSDYENYDVALQSALSALHSSRDSNAHIKGEIVPESQILTLHGLRDNIAQRRTLLTGLATRIDSSATTRYTFYREAVQFEADFGSLSKARKWIDKAWGTARAYDLVHPLPLINQFAAFLIETQDIDAMNVALPALKDQAVEPRTPIEASAERQRLIVEIHIENEHIDLALKGIRSLLRHVENGPPLLLGQALTTAADLLSIMGAHGESVKHLREAVTLFEKAGLHVDATHTWRKISTRYIALGNTTAANTAILAAENRKRHKDSATIAYILPTHGSTSAHIIRRQDLR